MAEVTAQATKPAPGVAGRAWGARQAAAHAPDSRRTVSEPGESAERSASARSVRAQGGVFPAQRRSLRQRQYDLLAMTERTPAATPPVNTLSARRYLQRRAVVARYPGAGQHDYRASGESTEASLSEGEEWVPATGDGGSAAPAQGPKDAGVPAPAVSPRLKKTTVDPLRTVANGGFNWGVRWSIDNATPSTAGWIVQHVVVRQSVEARHPPPLPGATMPIVPGEGGYGGLRTSWYPLWEAWQVRGGAVFVGGSAYSHNADTYNQDPVGPNTKGTTEVVGRADFYSNLTLPEDFTVRNAAPAWALPATNTNPNLTGGTGALDHNLTATWDAVNGSGSTAATPV